MQHDRTRDQNTPDKDQNTPNKAANMEPAEGSRETVTQGSTGGGITNREPEREQAEQEQLPPRGQSKSGGSSGKG